MDRKEIVRQGYTTKGAEYLAARSQDSEDVQLLQELVQRIPEGALVLDAGCGAGIPVTRILSETFDVIGVDFSEAQLRLARKLVPQAQFICQDMIELAFPDCCFNAICCYYAITHVPRREHRRLLHNFHRMLRPSGLALMCMGAGDIMEDIADDFFGTQMYWSHYDSPTNLKMLKECGFSIIWSRIVADATCPGSAHLFVLVQKK